MQALATAALIDRFNPAALRRFQQANRPANLVGRDLHNGLAVIMPCYNHAAYLDQTLASLTQQTYRPFDVIFIEDHATDDTLARLQQLCAQLPVGIHPSLLRTPHNSGQAFAINQGVAASQASLIVILNDDDYLKHDALEAIVEIMHQHRDLFLLGSTAVLFTGRDGLSSDEPNLLIRSTYPDYAAIPLVRYRPAEVVNLKHPNDLNLTHSGSAFFKTAWHAVGGYYPDKARRVIAYCDRDFQLRVASLFPVAVSQSVPFVFWRTDSSVDHGRNS